ncbi:MAG: metallophosphoesterase [Geminicoccales bacterium]
MRIIQLSDSHISMTKPARIAELEAFVRHINELKRQPDAVVHTGDVAHDGLQNEYETAKQVLDNLSAPYFVLAGNRDHRGHLTKVFDDGDHLQSGMDFVQYAVDHLPVRLIMLDTVSLSSNKGGFCQQRQEHLRHLLAKDTSRPAALFSHHPPFPVAVGPEPKNFEDWQQAENLVAEIGRHDNIAGLFSGHVHRSFETEIDGVSASMISSVVSDLRWDQPKNIPVFRTIDI